MRATRILERMRQRTADARRVRSAPVTTAFAGLLTLVLFLGLACMLLGVPAGEAFALNIESLAKLQAWRLFTFVFSCFTPTLEPGLQTAAAVFASSLIYCMCIAALSVGGPAAERRLGTAYALGMGVVAAVIQAAFTLVILGMEHAFSPVGPALAFLVFAIIVEFERNTPSTEVELDMRLVVLAFMVLVVAVAASFEPSFRPLLPGLLAGPVVAISAFAFKRKAERERVARDGSGQVGTLYYADETELLTAEELKLEADRLLEKISVDGYASLTPQQRTFLARASQRLRAVKPPEPPK